jgi:hypothetical protein
MCANSGASCPTRPVEVVTSAVSSSGSSFASVLGFVSMALMMTLF